MPVNFLPLPAWDDSVSSECDLSSDCDLSHTDCQKSDTTDRISQWINNLDEVAGTASGELNDDMIDSGEHEICDHEVGNQIERVEGMECHDISERMFAPSASSCLASIAGTSLVSDVET